MSRELTEKERHNLAGLAKTRTLLARVGNHEDAEIIAEQMRKIVGDAEQGVVIQGIKSAAGFGKL